MASCLPSHLPGTVGPFLKWAGGKRWLVGSGELPVPSQFERYIEPFVGGGAVFFHLRPNSALLSDANSELIELYTVMRDHPKDLYAALERHHISHSSEHYYWARAHRPKTPVLRAARTLYLNRTCFNGLYRVNRRGEFNVPIGTKTQVIYEGEDFSQISAALQKADLVCCDFEETIAQCSAGDFIFIDPPYTANHNQNGFLKYNETIFSWSDQLRLRESVAAAAGRGAAVVVTNADHESVRSLYSAISAYKRVERPSVLAGKVTGRKVTSEAIFSINI